MGARSQELEDEGTLELQVYRGHEDLVDLQRAVEEIGADKADEKRADLELQVTRLRRGFYKRGHSQNISQEQGS